MSSCARADLDSRGRPARSRVVRLAGLGGTSIYPTQVYSILANLVSALGLGFLAWPGQPLAPAAGLGAAGALTAFALAALVGLAMGVDSPTSTRRFGRLT